MKIIANKWSWLLIFVLGWTAAGFAMFGGTDDSQRARAAAEVPKRIVSMAPNLTEILFALGLEDEIVGITSDSDYPPAAEEKADMGTFWQPNIEAVIATGPELIVTLGFNQQTTLSHRLNRLDYNTLTVSIETFSQLFEGIARIGAVTDRTDEARRLSERLRKKLDSISELVAAGQRPKVLWVVQINPLRVAGTDTFINELIELAGGVNAIGATINKYPPIGPEQVIACAPDVIIDVTDLNKEPLEYFSRFGSIGAVENERIYVIDPDIVLRLGPRTGQAVEVIARCLRPEVFRN